ncbi:MAG: response regulator, partial [bacterium]
MAAKKHKILIVDDEPNFLRSMKDVLELEEFEVSTKLRARDALAFLQGNRADVMITDLRMPQMSGIELLRQVKANWPETIVFMLTAYGSIRDAVMCMKLGAENYIMKPVNIKDLVGHLGQALANRANNGNSSSERKKE